MEWVKLDTTFYLDAAVIRAGEAAEVLFVRAMAYCGDQENDGIVPREILPRLAPTRARARAATLVTEGLWEVVPEGWRFVSWHRHQRTRQQIEAEREAGRARQSRHRVSNAVSNAVTNGAVTEQSREEEEVDAAAAASRANDKPTLEAGLPAELVILRGRLDAANLRVRWDKLTADTTARMVDLQHRYGDSLLVEIAKRSWRADSPPQFAQAWLRSWENHDRLVQDQGGLLPAADPCPAPGHSGTLNHCAQCASEAKAAK